jgi:hypothetical protein
MDGSKNSLRLFSGQMALLMALMITTFMVAPAFADEDGDVMDYDSIVDQLHKESNSTRAKTSTLTNADPFADVWMHGGVGLSTILQTVQFDDGQTHFINQRGVQAALGIDLFSPYWMAEGTARNFGETEDSSVRTSVQEFELKVYNKNRLSGRLGYRFGVGLSARYLTIKRTGHETIEYTTPSGVATAGIDFFMSPRFSVGADFNGRSALIGETVDKNSIDGTVRVDAHF